MNDVSTDDRKAELDAMIARFEERVEKEENPENRPEFDRAHTVETAIAVATRQLAAEEKRLEEGNFRMASQEQATREQVRDLTWHIQDLLRLRDDLAGLPSA